MKLTLEGYVVAISDQRRDRSSWTDAFAFHPLWHRNFLKNRC